MVFEIAKITHKSIYFWVLAQVSHVGSINMFLHCLFGIMASRTAVVFVMLLVSEVT